MATEDFKPEDQMSPEEIQAITDAEEFVLNFKDEDYDDPDKFAELKEKQAQLKTTIHQKRHFREKVKELSTQKPPAPTKPEEKKPEKKEEKEEAKGVDTATANEFRLDHPELPKEVAKRVIAHASAYNISPEEALKDPLMKKYVEDELNKKDIDDASTAPGNRSGTGPKQKDWSTASEADIQAQRNKVMGFGN